ncbi:PD-(D/E)XK nuclease family protein [Saprospira grandis]|uniref:PD-(D/E)XK nuclease family protein n=1 Tax=Saprospira grandis TaxID=1008 RepID=UPI0022DDFFD0|nr:PD-(D/E)XK nuclease family protein [Saprospira grandis]WBM75340.1 PD-(D/E)XK nuclease family protein [Saprospira grandis]
MTEVTQHLLTQTATIGRLYDKIEKSQGLRFNIFELLNVQYDEVSTHSAFIADLLDPRGSHDRGSIFLKAFYDSILTELKFDPAANYEVAVEHYIGKKQEKREGELIF